MVERVRTGVRGDDIPARDAVVALTDARLRRAMCGVREFCVDEGTMEAAFERIEKFFPA